VSTSGPPARIPLSPVVRNKALAAGAADWIENLPELVAGLERDWRITVGRPYDGGTEAFVAQATLGDGTPAVLKLVIPRTGEYARHEIAVLRLTEGDGCARLLRSDETRGAMLLERLGRPLEQLGLPMRRRHEILCTAARQVWRPAADFGLPTGAEKGRWLIDYITATWTELGRPCSERTVDHALACADRRVAAHDDERAVLVHGDVHQWNALEAPGGFKLVDPDGLLAEAEYDLGIVMREDPAELMRGDARERARWLARRCGLDAVAIWEWGVVERVSTGLLCTSIGLQPVGREMLTAADHVAGQLAVTPGARRCSRWWQSCPPGPAGPIRVLFAYLYGETKFYRG
jgi:streptomycin 6-kinase